MTSMFRIASFGLLALSASLAHAHNALTRDQVRAALADAVRSGQLLAPGESGATLRELNPQRYANALPSMARPAPTARAEVVRELLAARQAGEVPVLGEQATGLDGRALGAPPIRRVDSALTRAQVVAAYREAARTGGLLGLGETGHQTDPAASGHH